MHVWKLYIDVMDAMSRVFLVSACGYVTFVVSHSRVPCFLVERDPDISLCRERKRWFTCVPDESGSTNNGGASGTKVTHPALQMCYPFVWFVRSHVRNNDHILWPIPTPVRALPTKSNGFDIQFRWTSSGPVIDRKKRFAAHVDTHADRHSRTHTAQMEINSLNVTPATDTNIPPTHRTRTRTHPHAPGKYWNVVSGTRTYQFGFNWFLTECKN